jgi:predicted nucleotidyltransferase
MSNFRELVRRLVQMGVEFIVVGGAAATAHGAARLTKDLDIVYRRDRHNIARIAAALGPYAPYLRGAPPDLPFTLDEATIERGLNFTLTTSLGDLDLLGEIVGGRTYEDLLSDTVRIEIFGVECLCLGLERLIRVKRAAGRPKDFEAIAELEAILEEQARANN